MTQAPSGLVVQPATCTTKPSGAPVQQQWSNWRSNLLPFGADDVKLHLALLSSPLAVLFPGADRVSARAELTRLLLTAGATEGVDLTCKLYSDQTCTADHGFPPCTRQGTGDSAGPEVDVLERAFWHRFLYADIGDRHATAALQQPGDLFVDAQLVGAQVDHAVGYDYIGPPGIDR